MKTYLICTLILWIFGILVNMKDLSTKKAGSNINVLIGASLVQLLFIIWTTYLLATLSA